MIDHRSSLLQKAPTADRRCNTGDLLLHARFHTSKPRLAASSKHEHGLPRCGTDSCSAAHSKRHARGRADPRPPQRTAQRAQERVNGRGLRERSRKNDLERPRELLQRWLRRKPSSSLNPGCTASRRRGKELPPDRARAHHEEKSERPDGEHNAHVEPRRGLMKLQPTSYNCNESNDYLEDPRRYLKGKLSSE